MDSLHAIGFYVSSGVSLAGALGVALLPLRDQRGVALGVVGIGLAGLYLSLSAGFAAPVALLCYAGGAWLLAGPRHRSLESGGGPRWGGGGAPGGAGVGRGFLGPAPRRGFGRAALLRGSLRGAPA